MYAIYRQNKWLQRTQSYLLQFVVIDDVLVGRARLRERVQLVHVVHVAPQRCQVRLPWEWGKETVQSLGLTENWDWFKTARGIT